MLATREDVLHCYRLLLNREPENESVITRHLANAPTVWSLIGRFLEADETKIKDQAGYEFSIHKCLDLPYLARNFTGDIGIKCYSHNLDFIHNSIKHEHFLQLVYGDIEIHTFIVDGDTHSVTLQFSRSIVKEGEFSLYFRANAEFLYVMSFSFLPGSVLGSGEDTVLLISRMQGTGGKRDEMRKATKAADEVAPQAYLFSILQGIAKATNIVELYGVHSTNQVGYDPQFAEFLERSYDNFFTVSGLEGPERGFYKTPLPLPQKSLLKTVGHHRLRTKFKREIRGKIIERADEKWHTLARPPNVSPHVIEPPAV